MYYFDKCIHCIMFKSSLTYSSSQKHVFLYNKVSKYFFLAIVIVFCEGKVHYVALAGLELIM